MGRTGAVAAAETLLDLGVTHVFGNPGTTELPFVEAVVASELRYVTCLHEDVAVGAAAGFATRTRQLAGPDTPITPLTVASVHATPGVAHAMGNLYGARFSRAPVLMTAGCQAPRHERRDPPLSGDRLALVDDHVKDTRAIHDVDDLPAAVASAARTALSPPMGPVYLEFPLEVQDAETDAVAPALGAISRPGVPDDTAIDAVADMVASADTVTLVVGDDLARAGNEAIQGAIDLAETLGAAVYAEPLHGELAFPTGHPNWVGMLPLEAPDVREAYDRDVVILLGCTRPEPLLDYKPPLWPDDTSAIWIGAYPEDVPPDSSFDATLAGELSGAITRLVGQIPGSTPDGAEVVAARESHVDAATRARRGQRQGELDAKARIAYAVAEAAQEAVIVDEGVTTGFLLRDLTSLPPGRFIGQNSGGLGYGLPASIGTAIAESIHADDPRPTVALIGDGTFQYYPQAIYTAARHVATPLTVVVPDNAGYGILRDRDIITEDDPEEQPLTFDTQVNVARNVESYGVTTRTIADVDALEDAIADSIASGRTEVIVVDIRETGDAA